MIYKLIHQKNFIEISEQKGLKTAIEEKFQEWIGVDNQSKKSDIEQTAFDQTEIEAVKELNQQQQQQQKSNLSPLKEFLNSIAEKCLVFEPEMRPSSYQVLELIDEFLKNSLKIKDGVYEFLQDYQQQTLQQEIQNLKKNKKNNETTEPNKDQLQQQQPIQTESQEIQESPYHDNTFITYQSETNYKQKNTINNNNNSIELYNDKGVELQFLGSNYYLLKNQDLIQYITPTLKILYNLNQRMSSFIFFGTKQYFQGDITDKGQPSIGFFIYENSIKPSPVFFEVETFLPKQESRTKIVHDQQNKQMNMENLEEFNKFVKTVQGEKSVKQVDIFGNMYDCEFDEYSQPLFSEKKASFIQTDTKIIQFKRNSAISFSFPHFAYIKYEINTQDPKFNQLYSQIMNNTSSQVHAINGFKFFGSLQEGNPYSGKLIFDYKNTLIINCQPILNQPYQCKIFFGNGQFYEGEIQNGYYNGHGIFGNNFVGKILDGEFKNDVFIKGKIYYQKLDKCSHYEGEVKLDFESQTYVRHGYGTLFFKNGDTYSGLFNDGLYSGLGHLIFHDGSRFSGNFVNGLKEGEGLYTNSRSQIQFKGIYSANKRHGNGMEQLPSGEYYEGQFQNNVREGMGTLKFPEGNQWEKYSGQFSNGKMHGEGVLVDANGRQWKVKMYKSTVLRKEFFNNNLNEK